MEDCNRNRCGCVNTTQARDVAAIASAEENWFRAQTRALCARARPAARVPESKKELTR